MIRAPFTPEQVEALNRWQASNMRHPYTCPGTHPECREHRELFVTRDGLICQCGRYKQDWAHG